MIQGGEGMEHTSQRLGTQEEGVGAVNDSVGHVSSLGTCGAWRVGHSVHQARHYHRLTLQMVQAQGLRGV